jgi:hypothetical protein
VIDLGKLLEACGPLVPHADILHPGFLFGGAAYGMRRELTPKLIGAVAAEPLEDPLRTGSRTLPRDTRVLQGATATTVPPPRSSSR